MARVELTADLITRILQKVQSGLPFKYAAAASGASESAFYKWRDEGEEIIKLLNQGLIGTPETSQLNARQELLVQFVESFKEARAKAIERNISLINVAAAESWQAAAWYLERTAPEDFGRRETHDLNHSGKIDGTLTLAARDIGRMTPEDRIKHAQSLREKMNLLDAPIEGSDDE